MPPIVTWETPRWALAAVAGFALASSMAPALAQQDEVCSALAKRLVSGRAGDLQQQALSHPHDSPDHDAVRAVVGAEAFERHFFQQHAVERVRVDLDGDGKRDHAFLQIVGGDHCPRLTVFGADGGFLAVAGSELWCGWSPIFLGHGGANYLLTDDHAGGYQLASLDRGKGFRRLCDLHVGWAGEPGVDAAGCAGAACEAVAAAAPGLIAAPAEIGGGRAGVVDFVRNGQTFRTDGGRFVDLDNDGSDEYVRAGRGNQDQLYVEIFRRSGPTYADADALAQWPGFDAISPGGLWTPFFAEEKLDFVRAGGVTALVAVAKNRDEGAFAARHSYRLGVFVIEGGVTRHLGDIVTEDRPKVSVEPCRGDCALTGN